MPCACCCTCDGHPELECVVRVTVGGQEFTAYPTFSGGVDYSEIGTICESTRVRYYMSCSGGGKYKLGIGPLLSGVTCQYWDPDKDGVGGYVDVYRFKARLRLFEINACLACSSGIEDLGVEDYEMWTTDPLSGADPLAVAMDGGFVSDASCGMVCEAGGDPDECPDPPVDSTPSIDPSCDPLQMEVSATVVCCTGACCIDGALDATKTSRSECESAGGTWHLGQSTTDPCWCCSYRYVCLEQVESNFGPIAGPRTPNWWGGNNAADSIPASQPPGVLSVYAGASPPRGNLKACAGTSPGTQDFPAGTWCFDADPCGDGLFNIRQWYYRFRMVDSCDECSGVLVEEMQFPDGYISCCSAGNPDATPPVPPVAPYEVASCDDCPYTCNDFGTGCPVNRVTALSCVALSDSSCSTRDAASPTPPTWSDCLEETGVSMCANEFP